ncbi:putative manganese transporter [Muricaecibacterium torontonense]|jgi:hypothetical protein|nr:putative manganese transporter [Muricaecibacterium torontonense]
MQDMVTFIGEVVGESVQDTLVLMPFLYVTYLAMEWLEHSAQGFSERVILKAGKAGPILGALLGALPQCGFSAMGATLYSGRVVTLGTLIAVFLSTSDEMLPVFIANGAPVIQIVTILAFKVSIGMVAGLLVDLAVRIFHIPTHSVLRIHELCEQDHCGCDQLAQEPAQPTDGPAAHQRLCESCAAQEGRDHEVEALAKDVYLDDGDLAEAEDQCAHDPECTGHFSAADKGGHSHQDRVCDHGAAGHDRCCAHGHSHGHGSIWKSALVHTVQVTLFIFVITLVLEFVIDGVGEDVFATFLLAHPDQAVLYSALVGLIPNCAASVLISELYLQGALGSGAMISGLLVGAGVGLLVLFRANRPMRSNLGIVALLFFVAVLCGFIVNLSGFVF